MVRGRKKVLTDEERLERKKEANRKYREKNKEKIQEIYKSDEYKEKMKVYRRNWYLKNRERILDEKRLQRETQTGKKSRLSSKIDELTRKIEQLELENINTLDEKLQEQISSLEKNL